MPSLHLVLGLTDQKDESSFRFDPDDITAENRIAYNLYKQNPDIEKATISWKLNTNLPGVLTAIDMWENTIRSPHLNMINSDMRPHPLAPKYNNISTNISFISLFPRNVSGLKEFELVDYENITDGVVFGDLTIEYVAMATASKEKTQKTLLQTAFHENTLEDLTLGPDKLYAIPNFEMHFSLGNNHTPEKGKSESVIAWMTKHKDELENLGYKIDDPKSTFGTYVIGKLEQDPMDVYEMITTYRYVCRTSIIKED